MQGFFGVGGQIGCQFLRKARTDILAPVCHLADGGCQLLAGAFLVDVAGAARLEHLRGMRLFGEHAQNEDGTARVPAFYFLDQLYSASAGHGKVDHAERPRGRPRLEFSWRSLPGKRFPTTSGRGSRVAAGAMEFYLKPRGMHTLTLVPLSRTPAISIAPPNGRTRSRIPKSPSDFESSIADSAIPRPLSSTVNTRAPESTRIATSILVAFAWRATLVSNS